MGEKLPQPANKAIEVTKTILEKLIEGVGVDVAVGAAIAIEPALAHPFLKFILNFVVGKIAAYIDKNLFNFAVHLIIRAQSDARKEEFNSAIQPIIQGSPTDAEIKAARDAADRLIERGHR